MLLQPMKTSNRTFLLPAFLLGGLVGIPGPAFSELTSFTVDSTQSVLTVSASLTTPLGTIQLQPQGPGSLTTTYEGTVKADVTAASIEFVGGSAVRGQNNGDWEPGLGGAAGTALANYGGQADNSLLSAKAAMREILVDLQSGPLTITAGTFPAEALVFGFPSNATSVLDYSYDSIAGSDSGSYNLTSYSTNSIGATGSLARMGNELVLTIPVHYSGHGTLIFSDDLAYTLDGQLVARATAAAPPLRIGLNISADQLVLAINTEIGSKYTILSATNLPDPPIVLESFTATENPTLITNRLSGAPQQYFRVRQD